MVVLDSGLLQGWRQRQSKNCYFDRIRFRMLSRKSCTGLHWPCHGTWCVQVRRWRSYSLQISLAQDPLIWIHHSENSHISLWIFRVMACRLPASTKTPLTRVRVWELRNISKEYLDECLFTFVLIYIFIDTWLAWSCSFLGVPFAAWLSGQIRHIAEPGTCCKHCSLTGYLGTEVWSLFAWCGHRWYSAVFHRPWPAEKFSSGSQVLTIVAALKILHETISLGRYSHANFYYPCFFIF